MGRAKRTTLILLMLWFAASSASRSQELFNFKNLKKEYSYKANVKKTNEKAKVPQILSREIVKKDKLKIVYISKANLFVTPQGTNYPQAYFHNIWPFLHEPSLQNLDFMSSEPYFYGLSDQGKKIIATKITSPPPMNGAVMYKETQLLLQESIREILKSLPLEAIDMVVFGGDQVYSNDQIDLFLDIAADLQKYQVPYYQVIGQNENRGSVDLGKHIKNKYYMLKTKGTTILVLDNASSPVVPENLPEEATEQYLWLKTSLASLAKTQEDLIIFSYRALDQSDIQFINLYPSLNLKLVAFTGDKLLAYEDKQKIFAHKSNPVILSNSILSAYPCSYTVISRDAYGKYKIEEVPINLREIRELAKLRASSK